MDYDRVLAVPENGKRYVLERDAPEIRRFNFNRMSKQAQAEPQIILRCTEPQYDLLVDDTSRIVCGLGGLGSGKTMIMASWFARKWVLRGGPGALFWLISSELEGSYFLLKRLILGDYEDDRRIDPILPFGPDGEPALVLSMPKTAQQPNKKTILIDGSIWDLKHAAYRAGSLKRVSLQAALTDETCEFKSPSTWDEIVGRTRASQGQVGASTVPEDGHWLQKKLAERKDTKKIKTVSLSMRDNCWLPEDEYATQRELINDESTADRVLDGLWTKTGPKVWVHWRSEVHTVSGVSFDCEDYKVRVGGRKRRLISLNEKFGIAFFPWHEGGWRFFGGQDFNAWPMGTLWWILCHPEGTDPQDKDNWHMFVADEVTTGSSTRPSTIYRHCEYMLDIHEHREGYPEGIFSNLPVSCDASGKYQAAPGGGDDTMVMIEAMRKYGYTAEPCRMSIPTSFNSVQHPQNPAVLARIAVGHVLMRDGRLHVHDRCSRFIHALKNQLATDKGKPKKPPGSAADRLSSLPDCFGYGGWPFFGESVV